MLSNKNSGGPVAFRIKCKFFVYSSLISSACPSYLVTKHTKQTKHVSQLCCLCLYCSLCLKVLIPLSAPHFPLGNLLLIFKTLQRSYCLDEFFPIPPGYTRWLCLKLSLNFIYGTCNLSGSVFVWLHLLVCMSLKGKGPIVFIFLVLAPRMPPD